MDNKDLGALPPMEDWAFVASPSSPPVSPVPASIPSVVARIIARRLDAGQREFILRMKPHQRKQTITKRDFQNIEPCVEYEPDGWPDVYWFGGMRGRFGPGAPRRPYSFMFNEVGLEVCHILRTRAFSAPFVTEESAVATPFAQDIPGDHP